MSAAAISFEADMPIPPSGAAQLNGAAPSTVSPAAPIMQNPGAVNDPGASYSTAGDGELVSAARSGDQHAFVELCRRYTPLLKRRIRRIVRNPEDTEDMLQDTLIRAFSNLPGFRAKCSFQTWIMTIATNTSLMLLRKRRNHRETGFGLMTAEGKEFEIPQLCDPMPNPEQMYARRQACHKVSQAVRMLPQGFRVLVESYHRDEVKLVDAAHAIGITHAAAKSRLFRARNILRRSLAKS